MKTTISLKQLRTDPREYVRLLNSGYEVVITEHRKTIARAVQPKVTSPKRGDVQVILQTINSLPKITVLDAKLETPVAIKRAKTEHLANKYSRR